MQINISQESLVEHLNKHLRSDYKFVINNIPKEYIKNENTKCVEIKSQIDNSIYTDWYYNEFTTDKLKNSAERMLVIDRDMDPELAGEFVYLARTILSTLNTIEKQ